MTDQEHANRVAALLRGELYVGARVKAKWSMSIVFGTVLERDGELWIIRWDGAGTYSYSEDMVELVA